MRRQNSTIEGSVLIWTILTITILSLVSAELLHVLSGKYMGTLHTATWQESLLAAESGVDLAIVQLRKSLFPAPNHAWEGWSAQPGNGVTGYGLSTIPNAGLAGTPMTIEVNVDAPSELKDPSNSWQYYRIRTVGTMPITGPGRVSDNKQDTHLRKLSLRWDRFTDGVLTSQAVSSPRVSRRVEAIVRPVSAFDQAIVSMGSLDLVTNDIVIDSYDSRDPLKSTRGLYDLAKRQENGNIATNGNLLNAGNAHVYGDVSTNSGTAVNVANVTGVQRTDFYQEPIPVSAPNWPSINPSPRTVVNTTTLTGSTVEGAPSSRYVLNTVDLNGGMELKLAGNPDGSRTYIEVYVTGDITAVGISKITVQDGVVATIYFAGNVDVQGNGLFNESNQPGNLRMYGVTPASSTDVKTFHLGGNPILSAAVYAPNYDIDINNTGTRGSIYGSFVGKTVKVNGFSDLHYDEALASGGIISNYKIVSWFEDTR